MAKHSHYDPRSFQRFLDEEHLSDEWAKGIHVQDIDVVKMNESCTAPEMRYISKRLGSLKGKSVLDIGCGLGEASVYFALKGAKVTAVDISHYMTDTAFALARVNKTSIRVHQSSIELLKLPSFRQFDVIYVGNLFHHVDIEQALDRICAYLKPKGVLVSWEPVHYNPIINVYRKIATRVRSREEHPLRLFDLKRFDKRFKHVETKWFWLTTLVVFIVMAFVQRRNPNKERFWKVVVKEGNQWEWIYKPLEAVDRRLIGLFPPLRLMCWNVVIVASNPRKITR